MAEEGVAAAATTEGSGAQQQHVNLLGAGNPLLDLSAEVPTELLEKYDVTLNNAILAEERHLPLYRELVENFPVEYIAGGATQNSIRVAQWMLQDKPGSCSYMGAIGDDDFGETLQKCASEDGVRTHYFKNESVPTGTCAVLVHGGERSLIANLAAANTFPVEHMQTETATELIDGAGVYYIAGFFLTVSVESILHIAKHAAANRKIFAMNLSAPFLVQFFGEQMAAVMPYTDYVFGNESEALAYGEAKGWGSDIPEIALRLAALPKASGTRPRVVIVTQGKDPTIVAVNGQIREFPVELLPKELLVDTNGAGDSFVGGFLSRLMLGADLDECVRAGSYAARVIIQRSGCSLPTTCDYA